MSHKSVLIYPCGYCNNVEGTEKEAIQHLRKTHALQVALDIEAIKRS